MVDIKDLKNTAMGKIPLEIRAEIGSTDLRIDQLMKIGRGAIIEISKNIESPIDLKIGNHLIGHAQLEVNGDYFSLKVLDMVTNSDETLTLFHTGGS